MKNILILLLFVCAISCKAQIYPLRTYGVTFPKDSYVKDTNNELPAYEGAWKGSWGDKTIVIYFQKVKAYFSHLEKTPYYIDILKGRFIVFGSGGNVLFDNTMVADADAKIEGSGFKKKDGKYLLSYSDSDICGLNGFIEIYFTDSTKTKLHWQYSEGDNMITSSCPYYNSNPFPEPLPKDVILTKQ